MSRVVITGGAGFIGSHLVDYLLEHASDQIAVIDNLFRGRVENIAHHLDNPRFSFVQADVRDYNPVLCAFADADTVFHLAGQSTVMGAAADSEYTFQSNVLGTDNVLRAAQRAGVRRVIYTSSREVYGQAERQPVSEDCLPNPKNVYGASKVAGEACCRAYAAAGLRVAILRLSNVYGPRDFGRVIPTFVDRAWRGLPLILYGGQQVLDFVWIETVVRALVRAAELDGIDGPINVGSGQGTSLVELANRIIGLFPIKSSIEFQAKRDAEVECFVADTNRMQYVLRLAQNGDSLVHLTELPRSGVSRLRDG